MISQLVGWLVPDTNDSMSSFDIEFLSNNKLLFVSNGSFFSIWAFFLNFFIKWGMVKNKNRQTGLGFVAAAAVAVVAEDDDDEESLLIKFNFFKISCSLASLF